MAKSKVFCFKPRQVVLVAIAAIAWHVGITPASAAGIHPLVAAAAQSGTLSNALIIMNQQANLSGASQLTTKAQKGAFVYNALVTMANRSQPPVLAQIRGMGLTAHPFWIQNTIIVQAPAGLSISSQQVQTLSTSVGVSSIQPTDGVQLITPVATQSMGAGGWGGPQPNLIQVGAPAVWAQGFTGQGIVVGSVDTGVYLHPDLLPKYRGYAGPGAPTNDDYNWFDPSTSATCSSPCDTEGHGTHVAGIMVGSNPWFQVGVAPGAQWIACRALCPGASASTILACLQFMLAPTDRNGNNPDPSKAPDVMNHSYFCNSCELQDTFAALNAAGIPQIVGNGNLGPRCRGVEEPADYSTVASVGAVDSNGVVAFFSSRGPTGTNQVVPDLVAPGMNILSTVPPAIYGTGYAVMTGTSMSTPHVTGAVALLLSARPALRGNVAATLGLLAETATHLVDTSCNNDPAKPFITPYLLTVPNETYGWGLIQVQAAFKSVWGN